MRDTHSQKKEKNRKKVLLETVQCYHKTLILLARYLMGEMINSVEKIFAICFIPRCNENHQDTLMEKRMKNE